VTIPTNVDNPEIFKLFELKVVEFKFNAVAIPVTSILPTNVEIPVTFNAVTDAIPPITLIAFCDVTDPPLALDKILIASD
jgi:hypothetical protein